jgi:hypothetical protein
LQIRLTPGFVKRINNEFDKFDFDIGILNDGPHYDAKRGKKGLAGSDVLTSFAGDFARKKSRTSSKKISDVAKSMSKQIGGDYLRDPFVKSKNNRDLLRFLKDFFQFRFGKSTLRRLENSLQAVVRNPILRKEYGSNSELTQAIKGFDRFGIDTGQWFKAIRAKVTKRKR